MCSGSVCTLCSLTAHNGMHTIKVIVFYSYASQLGPVPLLVFSFIDNIFKILCILLCLFFVGDPVP
jgi:hypothetical protein